MFTVNHFIWLGACALFILVGAILAVRKKLPERAACLIMVEIGVLSETSKILSRMELSESGGYILAPGRCRSICAP